MLVHSDNAVTVGYVNQQGGMKLDGALCLAQRVSRWAHPQLADTLSKDTWALVAR